VSREVRRKKEVDVAALEKVIKMKWLCNDTIKMQQQQHQLHIIISQLINIILRK